MHVNQTRATLQSSSFQRRLVARVLSILALGLFLSGCKTVVTSTTELRPSRYAVTEFARPLLPDSFMIQARRAVVAEGLTVQREDRSVPSVTTAAIKVPATGNEPALDAVVVLSLETRGAEHWIRVLASALLAQGQVGGQDARLAALVQRIRQRIETLTGR